MFYDWESDVRKIGSTALGFPSWLLRGIRVLLGFVK